jgi:hypothetical protein
VRRTDVSEQVSKTQQLVDALMAAEDGAYLLQPMSPKTKANALPHIKYVVGQKYTSEYKKEERRVEAWLVLSDSESIKLDDYTCDKWWIAPAPRGEPRQPARKAQATSWPHDTVDDDEDYYGYNSRRYD